MQRKVFIYYLLVFMQNLIATVNKSMVFSRENLHKRSQNKQILKLMINNIELHNVNYGFQEKLKNDINEVK